MHNLRQWEARTFIKSMHAHEKHENSTQKDPRQESNQEPSGYEVKVITITLCAALKVY